MKEMDEVLRRLREGELSLDEAKSELKGYMEIDGYARFDHGRTERTGIPEVILAEGKEDEALRGLVQAALQEEGRAVLSRLDEDSADSLMGMGDEVEWHRSPGVMVIRMDGFEEPRKHGEVAVVAAGTSDIPVAREAAVIAGEAGCSVEEVFDVGVAGIHRLMGELGSIRGCDAVVVAAGREGALPTVVAGLVEAPVIGLPVSVGYGFRDGGEAALSSMLQSCSVLSVVNIDAGFTAGAQAAKIARVGMDDSA